MTTKEYNQSVDLYADRVFRFIVKHTKNDHDAHDIVQNAYLILWKKHEEVSFEKVRQYLFTVAYNNMIDQIRKNRKTEPVEVLEMAPATHDTQYTGLKEVLEQALARLPEAQKAVILLRDYEGYQYEEIAEITGLNESQVKVYIHRARKFLKNHIGSIQTVL